MRGGTGHGARFPNVPIQPFHWVMTDPNQRPTRLTRNAPAPPGAEAWRSAARDMLRRREAAASRPGALGRSTPSPTFLEQATCVSFQMDGLPLSAGEFKAAVARTGGACRTRSTQRARNHVAILRRIESLVRRGQPLQSGDVVRWYTSIACGLSAGGIADGTLGRIDRIVSAVNSPRLRFWPAVKEVAELHVNLLSDPFVPGFNGILARLLLRYHMGRCGLPAVVFDPATDPALAASVTKLEPRLLELIVKSYDGNAT